MIFISMYYNQSGLKQVMPCLGELCNLLLPNVYSSNYLCDEINYLQSRPIVYFFQNFFLRNNLPRPYPHQFSALVKKGIQ